MKNILKRIFCIHGDTASFDEIQSRILDGGAVTGSNLCILILAILIASIGLNMNSTAVVIGAMLVSPLMGGIMAISYGIATTELKQVKSSAIGFLVQVVVSLLISTLYFLISPIKTPSAEILLRTNPTIWDVMIACLGGSAGIIGMTRKEKSNVIPGVAIATALMPPLCTAGYGIANSSLKFFTEAMYLFVINCFFIGLTSLVVLLILNVPKKSNVKLSPKLIRKMKHKVVLLSLILIIPSVCFGYEMVIKEVNSTTKVESSTRQAFNVETTTKEIQLLFPEVKSLKVGYMDQFDSLNKKESEKLLAVVYVNDDLNTEDKEKVNKLLKIKYNLDDVIYYKE